MPNPNEYLPEEPDGLDDWDKYQAMMANEPPPQYLPDAWEALAERLTAAQRKAAVDGGENPRIDGAIAADATDARRACSPLRRLAPEPKFDKLVCAVVRCSAHFDVDMNYFG